MGIAVSAALWMPDEERGVRTLPCHRWWDAVRMPRPLGQDILARLGSASGPLIEDQFADTYTWLVECGAADGWEPLGARVLGMGSVVAVPPARWQRGRVVRWLVPPTATCLTDATRLRRALGGGHV
ncbi:hypothetical protein [Streptomyces sp. URMC 129]|uniref:hypothetical protein n=1 Tax=Streptomyces sp. URMC 129 TaxID=3423407 RepID=UPI003F1C76AB